ncbi:MAG: response regulator [Rhodoferax sp.]|nr:response regulator [Rhodoferax sp.]MCF8211880.1 response regulator [Rhodoferax sp.]
MPQPPANVDTRRPVILCVDDEPSILSALRRLFRTHGYQVLLAESGQAGLEMLAREPVDLVISDMRMPEMDGVVFLEHVRKRWPDILRLLLTGYADITSIMGAINRGEIYRYVAKPWDDNDIILTVQGALDRSVLVREKKRLEALVLRQNEELKAVNASLEVKVEERTSELKQANGALNSANERLKTNFITSIKMFTALIELRDSKLAGHSRRVAELSRRLAQALALDSKQSQELFVAGLLHAIGKVGFDDELLGTPISNMNPRQLETYRKHPARAEQLLMPLGELKGTLEIIAAQLERFDGSGYPLGTSGRHIVLGARILAVASDYDSLQIGVAEPRQLSQQMAQTIIIQRKGRQYDPVVIDAFESMFRGIGPDDSSIDSARERATKSIDLQPEMVLSRDLISPSGLLLLTAGHILDDAVIRKIMSFERSTDVKLTLYIWHGSRDDKS